MQYTVRPINTGFICVDHGVHVAAGVDVGRKVEIPATAWLIQGGSHVVLVDTGMCDTDRANKWHHPGSSQPPGHSIHERLNAMGITEDSVKLVVFTHLHWDHCSNMKRFTKARFVAHADEVAFARDPLPPYYRSYEAPALGLEPPFSDVQFEVVHGEEELLDGIWVFPTPGHSPGHQSVLVSTSDGPYVIAGDAVFAFENLRGDQSRLLPFLPIGRFTDFRAMWKSIGEIANRGVVLPGHDIDVFEKALYP